MKAKTLKLVAVRTFALAVLGTGCLAAGYCGNFAVALLAVWAACQLACDDEGDDEDEQPHPCPRRRILP